MTSRTSGYLGASLVILTALAVAVVLSVTRPQAVPVAQRSVVRADARTPARATRPRHATRAATLPLARVAPSDSSRTADPVGVLFTRYGQHLSRHFCTASVVASRSGDLLITAAHCMLGVRLTPVGRIVFAPGYNSGRFPHGLWAVTRKFVDVHWAGSRDQNDDVAFLMVTSLDEVLRGARAPADPTGPTGSVERASGAERLRFGSRLPTSIRAIGYPDHHGRRVGCRAWAYSFRPRSLHQVRFVCPGFTDGTSGGPMLSEFSTTRGTGAIIGVIGGYQRGGDSPSISYSSAFAASIRALYRRASRVR